MSFLESIQNKKKLLNETKTVVTQIDGKRYVEDGNTETSSEVENKQYGFVVDTAPDNTPVEVILGVYIGSQDCVDNDVLNSHKITHIVSLEIYPEIRNISQLRVSCLDLPETDIMPVLNETNSYIKHVLETNCSVLVHCNAGVSRAAMVVIGFLIMEKNYSFVDAYNLVKTKRTCIQPNVGFVKQLKLLNNK